MVEITGYLNLPVYTSGGTFVGNVKNMVLDVANRRIHGLLVGKTNPSLVEGGSDVVVPYRWVRSFDDILLLSHFPEGVAPGSDEATEAEDAGAVDETTEVEIEQVQ